MKCSVCQREIAPDWSMCIRCGAMKNDTVREEMESSLMPISGPLRPRTDELIAPSPEPAPPVSNVEPHSDVRPRRSYTADLPIKKTSPTLAEFRNVGSQIPEWRLQLQNSVRQKILREGGPDQGALAAAATMAAGGSSSLRRNSTSTEVAAHLAAETEPGSMLSSALKRIEESRRAFLPTEKAREGIRVAREASRKFPFGVVQSRTDLSETPQPAAQPALAVRPKLVSSLRIEKRKYDTNKLVPIPEAAHMESSFGQPKDEVAPPLKENWSDRIEIKDFEDETLPIAADPEIFEIPDAANEETEAEDIEDLAPISMRFNAGLFDAIIGAFAAGILLSPFFAYSENWFAVTGILLYLAGFSLVMFIYLTGSIAFFGQTLGMRIFSLELVDIEESEFPSIHQAAVSSSVYLLSLAFGGLGFLPIFFNEERRAAHDLASGTILVKGM
ncbi:MAG TPA: RDD family protein [Pyrinomonadaceae bacterium]|nr:RDD family protein [Pyrinomonadaceae bacterium]